MKGLTGISRRTGRAALGWLRGASGRRRGAAVWTRARRHLPLMSLFFKFRSVYCRALGECAACRLVSREVKLALLRQESRAGGVPPACAVTPRAPQPLCARESRPAASASRSLVVVGAWSRVCVRSYFCAIRSVASVRHKLCEGVSLP
ncbi:unnamed protein product [Colias eurytheme]|nr:unnamed protein product [Colias eurytheme]